MNTRSLQPIVFLLILTVFLPALFADWRVHPPTEFEEEVRIWASLKESGMDFSWSGRVNANHEAEGYGILE
jgi:hypothetical protein